MKKLPGSTLQPKLLAKSGARKKASAKSAEATLLAVHQANQVTEKLAIVYQRVEDLKPSSKQVRRTNEHQLRQLRGAIANLGFISPVIVCGTDILDGHARLQAAKDVGITEVPTIDVSHLNLVERKALMVSVNRLSEVGEWNLETLRDTIIDLKVADIDLDITGFTLPELDIIMLDPLEQGASELNELPQEVAGAPVAREGDLWLLGSHKLLCGSATEASSYAALMASEPASMVLTDPPYNVKIAGNVSGLGKVKHGEFKQASGEMTDAEFIEFLTAFLTLATAELMSGGTVYGFMDWRHHHELHLAAKAADLQQINLIVWHKGQGGMGGLYRSAHELLLVFCKGDTPAINNVKLGANGRDRTNVWTCAGANKPGSSAAKLLKDHPTPKPVELLVDAMLDVTHAGDVVLDPFMGSGTTIIAAEECGRVARGIELDPKYVDLAVRRWEQVTGKTATLAGSGETFAAVAERRAAEAAETL